MSTDAKQEAQNLVKKALDFAEDSKRFIKRCSKPSTKELKKTATYCAIGFAVMGVVGYLIKLVFIPINNIILTN